MKRTPAAALGLLLMAGCFGKPAHVYETIGPYTAAPAPMHTGDPNAAVPEPHLSVFNGGTSPENPVPAYVRPFTGIQKIIADIITDADGDYDEGRKQAAAKKFRRAAGLLSPAVLQGQNEGRLLGTVDALAYYFAVTGDRENARRMWQLLARESISSNEESVADSLAANRPREAFALMLRYDGPAIDDVNPLAAEEGEPKLTRAGLRAGARGDYHAAQQWFSRASTCCDRAAVGYNYYALGITYWTLHERRDAINAWLAASRAVEYISPDMPTVGDASRRSAVMLLRFFGAR